MRFKQLAASAAVATLAVLGAPAFAGIAHADDSSVGPVDLSVLAGQSASFTATDGSCEDCTEQWLTSSDGGSTFTPISGATSSTYSFEAALSENGFEFEAEFAQDEDTDDAATPADSVVVDTTSAATLTVDALPEIVKQPKSLGACRGCTAKFTAIATGQPTPAVEWQYSTNEGNSWLDAGEGIPGIEAIPDGIEFRVRVFENGWLFRAVFTNDAGPAESSQSKSDAAQPDDLGGIATAITKDASLHIYLLPVTSTAGAGGVNPGHVQKGVTYKPTAATAATSTKKATTLPVTGDPVGWQLGAATGLLMTGAGLQLGNRRRRKAARGIRVINSISL